MLVQGAGRRRSGVFRAPDDTETCRRCWRLGYECFVPERRPRVGKSRIRGRVDQLENSYAEILSLLRGQNAPPRNQAGHHQNVQRDHDGGNTLHGDTSPQSFHTAEQRPDNSSLNLTDSALALYRKMSAEEMPFVIVPEHISAKALSCKRPMLAQAIDLVTSYNDASEQSLRREAFLRILSAKYLFECERSLDLLQALLVFFGWCHWYAAPFSPFAFRYASLAVSMAYELRINERPTDITQHQLILQSSSIANPGLRPTIDNMLQNETRRAYIGAWTVSVHCSLLFRKLTAMPFTSYLLECARLIDADPQQHSDTLILHHLNLLNFANDVTKGFDHGSPDALQRLTESRITFILAAITKQMTDWQATLPLHAANDPRLTRHILQLKIYAYEVGLYNLMESQSPSLARLEIIMSAFDASRDFLIAMLDLNEEKMKSWCAMTWRSLNFGLMVNSRAAAILDSFCYCNDSVQRGAWIDDIYGKLCQRLMDLHTNVGDGGHTFLKQLATDWDAARNYYKRCVDKTMEQSQATNTNADPMHTAGQQPVMQLQDGMANFDDLYNMSWNTFGGIEEWNAVGTYQ